MALVNALQSNTPEMFHQQGGEPSGRFMKIRSIWPFPVRGIQASGDASPDSSYGEPNADEAGDSVTPSSFVT
jgi:hypothetical protein